MKIPVAKNMKSLRRKEKKLKMTRATRDCLGLLATLIQNALRSENNNPSNTWEIGNTKEAVDYLTTKISREEANKLLRFASIRKTMFDKPELQNLYEDKLKDELFHLKHVRKCMDILDCKNENNKHDHTKDEYYFLITILGFDKEVGWSKLVSKELLTETINQHLHQEAHHPQYEEVPGQTIQDVDILEMVVDRLSRNLQFNNGKYNKEQWPNFDPVFLKDHKTKLKKYKDYRDCLATIVEQTWKNLKKE